MRRILCAVLLLVLFAAPAVADPVGTVVITSNVHIGGGIYKYTIAWTSGASGAVSGNTFKVAGKLLQVKFVPGAGADAPTTLYDMTLIDADSASLLVIGGTDYGANLSATVPAIVSLSNPVIVDEGKALDVVIANAGDANKGTVILWVER